MHYRNNYLKLVKIALEFDNFNIYLTYLSNYVIVGTIPYLFLSIKLLLIFKCIKFRVFHHA